MTDAYFTPDAIRARVVPIPGARNLRDMGGYPTRDGRRVRQAMLYRGGHPADIAVEHLGALEALGLRAIIDLRTTEERNDHPYPERLRTMLDYWSREYSLSGGEFMRLMRDPALRGEMMRDMMLGTYRRFVVEQEEGVATTFRKLLEGRAPLLVNCTAGKDRTGFVCAVLLTALGVPEDIVRRDYALSEDLHPPAGRIFMQDDDSPFAQTLDINEAVWRVMMRSEPAYIDAAFEALHETYGDMENYLHTAHGLDAPALAALRNMLLQDM